MQPLTLRLLQAFRRAQGPVQRKKLAAIALRNLQRVEPGVFGYQASEIVHIGQAIMGQPGEQNTLKYFVNTTFNYPTMAEAYRVAAYDGLNRLF